MRKSKFNELEVRMHKLAEKVHERDGSLPVLDRGQHPEQWAAWRKWRQQQGLPVNHMDRQDRYTVLREWPPVELSDMEAEYAGGRRTAL